MSFQKAVKHEAKLRLAIAGPSGSGKTYTSLAVATALANGGKIALVDTEHGSASKYADLFDFDVMEMTAPFHPDRFVAAINEAGAAGYSVIILDSLTHAWSGTGGMLDIVDEIAKRMRNPNSFAAWKDGTPVQNRMIEAIVGAPLHLIATMRSKQEYVLTSDDKGKQTPKKVGMAPQQRDGFEYEFDVFIDMDIDNNGIVQKTRCPDLTGRVFKRPGADVAGILTRWLQGAPQPKPATVTVEPPKATNGEASGQQAEQSVEPAYKRLPRPWPANVAVEAIRDMAAVTKNELPDNAAWRALIGHLDSAPFDTAKRHALMREVFGVDSSKALNGHQRYALNAWAKPWQVDGKWQLDGRAIAEYTAIVNPNRISDDALDGVIWPRLVVGASDGEEYDEPSF